MQKKSPWPSALIGLVMFSIGFTLIMLEITATEAATQGKNFTSFQPSFEILGQIPGLFTQSDPPYLIPSILLAWGIETLFLVFVVAYDLAKDALNHANSALVGLLRIGIGISVAIDWYTNWLYTTGFVGTFWRVSIATIMCIMVMIFPIVGFRLLEHAVRHYWSTGGGQQKTAMIPVKQHQGN